VNVFTVKVEKNANISALKDIIKQKKPRAFQHVDADDLDIWKVWSALFWMDVADRQTSGRPTYGQAEN
jgi:hypothetical protein